MNIQDIANEYSQQFKTSASSEGLQNIASDFIAGYDYCQPKWIELKTATADQLKDFEEADLSRLLLFFDNREVAWYGAESMPFAEITHFLIVPEFPVSK